ncbi:MAG: DUF2846 domain-containing protein [Thermoanaerobaculia bacterium]|nr:DUF2846 domain-containing protein [Thermoanaerobaculia bacterium]
MTILQLFSNFLLATAFICSLVACSTAKFSNPEEEQRLRTMSPEPGMALVYFVRPSSYAAPLRMRITCNGTPIGSTHGMRYVYAHLKPGKHEFISKAENKDELLIVTETGKTYFIEQIPKLGLIKARNSIELIDEADGRQKLAKCKLSGDCPAYKSNVE